MHHTMKGGARRQILLFTSVMTTSSPFRTSSTPNTVPNQPPPPPHPINSSANQPASSQPLRHKEGKSKGCYLIYTFLSDYSPALLYFKYNFLFPLPYPPLSLLSTPRNSRPGSYLGGCLRKLKPRTLPPLPPTRLIREFWRVNADSGPTFAWEMYNCGFFSRPRGMIRLASSEPPSPRWVELSGEVSSLKLKSRWWVMINWRGYHDSRLFSCGGHHHFHHGGSGGDGRAGNSRPNYSKLIIGSTISLIRYLRFSLRYSRLSSVQFQPLVVQISLGAGGG